MTKIKFSLCQALPVLAFSVLLVSLTHAQPALPTFAALQITSATNDADDADMDFANLSIPVKYVHGFKKHLRGPLPIPADPEARKRYIQAEEIQDKGVAYLYHRRFDKAIARLNQSRALWSDAASTYRWLAEAYEAKGETDLAIANYRLLFYGWPGKYVPTDDDNAKPKETPSDKPSDYDQPNPEEADPTLLMRFSLLLQQTNQYAEAQTVYERGMQAMADKFGATGNPLPPLSASSLTTPASLEAAARTALAIDQMSYQDKQEAEDNMKQAHLLQPQLSMKAYRRAKSTKLAKSLK